MSYKVAVRIEITYDSEAETFRHVADEQHELKIDVSKDYMLAGVLAQCLARISDGGPDEAVKHAVRAIMLMQYDFDGYAETGSKAVNALMQKIGEASDVYDEEVKKERQNRVED
jgi:hypothetical protein